MKDEGAIDWWERFSTSRKQAQGGVLEGYQRERGVSCVLREKTKEKNRNVRKKLILKYGKMLFMKKMCANKSMEGGYV
jgi:hypothetical protein